MSRRFTHVSQSSGSDDGLWIAIDGDGAALIELSYWEDMDSSAVETYGKYNVQAGFVEFTNPEHNDNALKSCGWALDAQGDIWFPDTGGTLAKANTKKWYWCLAECLWRHGYKDLAADESGNNRRELFKEARYAL